MDQGLQEELRAHSPGWTEEQREAVIAAVDARDPDKDPKIGRDQLRGWLERHANQPEIVEQLAKLIAPDAIEVLGQMSQIGSQKVVYDARWRDGVPIVLKQIKSKDVRKHSHIFDRELQPHPFRMTHPNIIETHKEGNRLGEEFLVEKKLPVALSDSWEVNGLAEAANLLYDIALALQFLHGRDLVHGDIKPDNLGFGEDRFILLDFGICRKSSQFSPDASATGSLRTRAPELLLDTTPHAFATDIYALGAVIFYFLTGTFPLFERNENVPRSSEEEKRAEKVDELKERASDRYSQLVFERLEESLDHEGMRHLLAGMLALDPHRRPDADQVVSDARSRLVAFIRAAGGDGALSLEERLDQLHSYLPEGELSSNLPRRRLIALQAELDEFEFNELDGDRKQALGELKKRTSEKGSS